MKPKPDLYLRRTTQSEGQKNKFLKAYYNYPRKTPCDELNIVRQGQCLENCKPLYYLPWQSTSRTWAVMEVHWPRLSKTFPGRGFSHFEGLHTLPILPGPRKEKPAPSNSILEKFFPLLSQKEENSEYNNTIQYTFISQHTCFGFYRLNRNGFLIHMTT